MKTKKLKKDGDIRYVEFTTDLPKPDNKIEKCYEDQLNELIQDKEAQLQRATARLEKTQEELDDLNDTKSLFNK